jgi:uncharacterized RDD family membrane protein YckC
VTVSSEVGAAQAVTPKLLARMACGLYESLLLFGVLAAAGLVYGLTLQPSANENWGWPFAVYLLAVMAGYFVWFWSRGETLAMATWHLRLRRAGSTAPPGRLRALMRFGLSWMWCLPGLLLLHAADLDHERSAWGLILGANIVGYALLARFQPQRQYLHDVLAGTEMVFVPGRQIKRKGEG